MTEARKAFQNKVAYKSAAKLASYVEQAKNGSDKDAQRNAIEEISASMAWVAFACPGAITSVYDAISRAWLELEPVDTQTTADKKLEECEVPATFWDAYWAFIDDADTYDAISITLRSAALTQYVHPDFGAIAERVATMHPGADNPLSKAVPARVDLDMLRQSPADSLAGVLIKMWVDNNFDPEVLDRDAIGLSQLPPALKYLNTRILQMHDVWHLIADYETTSLHEIAISGFQLAQFGHNYSSMFLAGAGKIAAENSPEGFGLFMHVVCEAWQHGRNTPCLMAIEWEEHWHKPIDELRDTFDISQFKSAFPADTIEQLTAASA